ncbi:type II toxin-antitoxin system prevent-host-death family antitoxin [Streptomyces sp. NPDC052676]|uniref:type II toxin-antitoxin system prevent-host-death family antitoxin n=1 Tax=Streptomyces sp. NPDC052676 TaxID=3154953 RepID=UPI00341A81ED
MGDVGDREQGIEAARGKLGELVNRAAYLGEVTYLTRNGRRVAAVVPVVPETERPVAAETAGGGASARVWCDDGGRWWVETPEPGQSAPRVRQLVPQGPAVPVEEAAGGGALRRAGRLYDA